MGRRANGEWVRALLAESGGSAKGRGAGYGERARREAIRYARARLSEGVTRTAVAREIGVRTVTLDRWLGDRSSSSRRRGGFARVAIAPAVETMTLSLVHASGWRIEGLDLDAVRALIGTEG